MAKHKLSGAAIFMYAVIAGTILVWPVCFYLWYGGKTQNNAVLWVGIVAFMFMYHFGLRIIMGGVTKLFAIDRDHRWFKERGFEKKLYKFLRVKKWKDKVLTYSPELFDVKSRTMSEIADTMVKAETDHWVNELISLASILFSLLWGETWIFVLTAVLAMLFDAQFIVIQRYNRPKVLRILKMQEARREREAAQSI